MPCNLFICLEMFTLNKGMNKLVEFLEQSAESSALPYLGKLLRRGGGAIIDSNKVTI